MSMNDKNDMDQFDGCMTLMLRLMGQMCDGQHTEHQVMGRMCVMDSILKFGEERV